MQTYTTQGRIWRVLRDVVIVTSLTALGGFVIGITGMLRTRYGLFALVVANLGLGTIGFCISKGVAPYY